MGFIGAPLDIARRCPTVSEPLPFGMQTPIFRTEEPLWFLETAWCSQTQMGLSESTVWDLQSLMGARQMWTLGDAGMGPSEMPVCGP